VGVTIEVFPALVGDMWAILRDGIWGRLRMIFLFCWLFLTREVAVQLLQHNGKIIIGHDLILDFHSTWNVIVVKE